jgi:single-strand DNA-binding protein
MATLNRYECIGRLGKDPELQVTNEGTRIAKFSVAVDQGKNQEALWWNVVCWNDLAQRMERMLNKGAQVYVEGRLKQRKYTDREGVARVAFDLVASNVQLLDKRPAGSDDDELGEPL